VDFKPGSRQPTTPVEWLALVRRALRQRRLILSFLVFGIAIGTAGAMKKSHLYRAETEIIVRPQNIPGEYIKSTVRSELASALRNLSQRIMSRSRLQRVIEEFRLYQDLRDSLSMLEIIEVMRRDIGVENHSSDSFKVRYRGKDPAVVRDVANTLAAAFIQANIKGREGKARTITTYLDDERKRAKERLEEIEGRLREFQEKHMGSLPNQEGQIGFTISGLSSRYQSLAEQIRSARSRELILVGRIHDEGTKLRPNKDVALPAAVELAQARQRLARLRRELTEDHPDIKTTRRLIVEFERKVKTGGPAASGGGALGTGTLRAELNSVRRLIADLTRERGGVQGQISGMQGRLAQMPRVAEEMAGMAREYEFAKDTYEDLRKKTDEARRAQQLEERQKGQQFEIVDKAVIPKSPIFPTKMHVGVIGVALGILMGLGLALARAFLDPTFHAEDELARVIPLPVLVGVPRMAGAPRKALPPGRKRV
jgi:succinoglycan biosynthesis transport protein ExoP